MRTYTNNAHIQHLDHHLLNKLHVCNPATIGGREGATRGREGGSYERQGGRELREGGREGATRGREGGSYEREGGREGGRGWHMDTRSNTQTTTNTDTFAYWPIRTRGGGVASGITRLSTFTMSPCSVCVCLCCYEFHPFGSTHTPHARTLTRSLAPTLTRTHVERHACTRARKRAYLPTEI
jgi:hypothetical protein